MSNAIVLAQELLACLQTGLTASAYPIDPQYVMLRAGAEVTPLLGTGDDECCRGLAWVRIARTTNVRQVGDRDNVVCYTQERVLTLEMGVARCAPMSGPATVPTEDQWTAAALKLDSDLGVMEAAVCCAFSDIELSAADEVAVGDYQPFGVDGNCIGGTLEVNIRMNACCPEA